MNQHHHTHIRNCDILTAKSLTRGVFKVHLMLSLEMRSCYVAQTDFSLQTPSSSYSTSQAAGKKACDINSIQLSLNFIQPLQCIQSTEMFY